MCICSMYTYVSTHIRTYVVAPFVEMLSPVGGLRRHPRREAHRRARARALGEAPIDAHGRPPERAGARRRGSLSQQSSGRWRRHLVPGSPLGRCRRWAEEGGLRDSCQHAKHAVPTRDPNVTYDTVRLIVLYTGRNVCVLYQFCRHPLCIHPSSRSLRARKTLGTQSGQV